MSANLNTVMAISVDSSIDKFAETIQCFTKAGISIEYMYCFSINQKAILVLRTNNIDAAHEVIRRYGMNNLSEAELNNL